MNLTRRTMFRAGGVVGGAASFLALGPKPPASASAYCTTPWNVSDPICLNGTTTLCRVRYGPPSCTQSRVVVHSPNDAYYVDCKVTCQQGCGCEPLYLQARGAVRNGGKCSCTAVAA